MDEYIDAGMYNKKSKKQPSSRFSGVETKEEKKGGGLKAEKERKERKLAI